MIVNLTPHALLFTIAAIGISESAYLIRKRIAAEEPICPVGEGCSTVLNSKYNRLFGVHNDILGMIFYASLAAIAALLVIDGGNPLLLVAAAEVMLIGATAMSIALIYIQGRILRAWCFWCLMSAATVGLMDIIMLTARLV